MSDTLHEKSDDLDLRAVFGVLRRQWRLILYVSIFTLGAAILWLVAVTPLYTARTLVQIDTGRANLLQEGQGFNTSPAADSARINSEVEILRSEAVALAVVQNADLISTEEFGVSISWIDRARAMLGFAPSSEPDSATLLRGVIERFSNALAIRRSGLTYLVEIDVTSRDPDRAATLANITAQTYIDIQVATKVTAALAARDVLAARLEQADAELTSSEEAFSDFIDANLDRIVAEDAGADIAALRREFERLRARGTRAEVTAQQARRAFELRNWQAVADELEDAVLTELAAQRAQVNAALADATEQQSIDLRATLDAIERELEERSSEALAAQMAEVESLSAQVADYRDDLRTAILSADLPPDLLTQVFSIQQQATLARAQYQTLLSRVRDFETQADLQVADARIVSPALKPIHPSFPDGNLLLALAVLGGLTLGTALAFLREFYIGGFVSDSQAEDVLGLRVPAAIPRLPEDVTNPAAVPVTEPLSLFAESFRRLRASIDQHVPEPSSGEEARIIMVASSLPGEGKTTTSLSLARTYALSGKRTLLIDSDLRKPSVAQAMTLSGSKSGLLDYLTQPEASAKMLEKTMLMDQISDLDVIASFGRPQHPTDQLLVSQRFTELLAEIRSHYDVVIIDTPPVLPVVDARYLARYAQAIVLVVKWSETRQQDVRKTQAILEESKQADVPVLVLLNQQKSGRSKGYYRGYYGYGQ